ncbi:Outer membrane protein-like protein iml2 [Venustampulla echinocandica]|uniref:Inclusion body clearance protein IML2 n=1 Tax=Venustampulla echinocandica TaxID=2656787 RepID=A0A370U296_9HELO|nr:Outer membrane protein-like protein iml2 [Venustampulla echinocandica]RDL41902.1 Outer membrane protein-like protein iml2 [Venustampulla echinocandica]
MASWFKSSAKAGKPAMTAEEEDNHLRDVERALLHLLNDDIAAADNILKQQESAYHYLGRGISSFISSMLGVEKELLREAANQLQAAENKTWEGMKKAQKEPSAYRSHIYPPGTEYLLCYAVSQLTSAICAVLSGSVTEAIKGFYKLRKAFLTLDSIMQIEGKYLRERAGSGNSLGARLDHSSTASLASGGPSAALVTSDEKAAEDVAEKLHGELDPPDVKVDASDTTPLAASKLHSRLLEIDPASVGITSHTDIFIHSGTRLCYGVLLVIFSMIENPLFTKILYIVGFKGDRERGTRYLWQAARFDNFNSAIAGIALLGYYNGLVGFCDILPTDAGADEDLSGYPRAKCRALLTDMRERYPESKLWKMEEARFHGYNRNLREAVNILSDNSTSQMKQIAAINVFEMSLTSLFLHDYELSAQCWKRCAKLSHWSPTMYAYLTGACFLEIYRNNRLSDPATAEKYKMEATEYIRKAPPLAGRQKVMSKELPFDQFICRKVSKWEERAKAWNVDLVDATGISPVTEMIYLWNGARKQNEVELDTSLEAIKWEKLSHPEKLRGDLDETALQALLKACALRNLKKYDEARVILTEEILNHDRNEFKGYLKDDWTCPNAHYEMACLFWAEKDLEGADHKLNVIECEKWLEKTKWDPYVLDGRLSMKVTTSVVTVKRHKDIMGYD